MELSPQQRTRYDLIRGIFNGPITCGFIQENRTDAFEVSLYALPQKFFQAHCETDTAELREILSSGLGAGWKFDAARETFTFRVGAVKSPPAPAAAPGISAAQAGSALTPTDRARIRWNESAEIRNRYPSPAQYAEAVAMGLA